MSQQGSASGVGRGGRGGGRGGRGGGRGPIGRERGSIGGGRGSGGRDQSVSGVRSVSGDRSVSGGGGRGDGDCSGASVDLHSLSRVCGSSRAQPPMFGMAMTPAEKMRPQKEA